MVHLSCSNYTHHIHLQLVLISAFTKHKFLKTLFRSFSNFNLYFFRSVQSLFFHSCLSWPSCLSNTIFYALVLIFYNSFPCPLWIVRAGSSGFLAVSSIGWKPLACRLPFTPLVSLFLFLTVICPSLICQFPQFPIRHNPKTSLPVNLIYLICFIHLHAVFASYIKD